MELNKDILQFHELFKKNGFELYPVGGCVRDFALNSKAADIDLATNALPEDIERILFGFNMDFTGKSFGVMRVFTESAPKGYEIATFREDISPGRKPKVKVGTTIEKDAERRDSTINALYYDIEKKIILDFVGGLEDLKNKRVMTPGGNPEKTLSDDRLRIQRLIRIADRFGFTIDPSVTAAIKKDNRLIGPDENGNMLPLPQERIIDEFIKGIEQSISPVKYLMTLVFYDLMIFPNCTPNVPMPFFAKGESKKLEIILSILFSKTKSLFDRMVKDFKFSKEVAHGTILLIDLPMVDETNAMSFKKRMDKTNLKDEDILEYVRVMNLPNHIEKNVIAFTKYKVTTNGDAMIADEGFVQGKVLGDEIARREKENFLKILAS